MDDALVDIAIDNPAEPNQPLHIVQATVTAVSPTTGTATVQYGSSSSVAGIAYLNGIPAVNDKVLLLEVGGTQCIIGTVANPAGTGQTGMIAWTRSASAPTGWAFCNGGAINSAYTALIALCGSNTPDLRNRIIIGAGSTYTLAATGGSTTSTIAQANLPSYNLTVTDPGHTHSITGRPDDATSTGSWINDVEQTTQGQQTAADPTGSNTTGITVASGGSGTALTVLNPYFALNPIIRAF